MVAQDFCGDNIFFYDTLESTSLTAKEMENAAHGTVVIAGSQTAGRGRHGRSFFSPPDSGIYMSFVLHPAKILRSRRVRTHAPTLITTFSAVAVCEAIEHICEKSPRIKWVNDLFLGGRKICGILANDFTDRIILGIGVNFTEPKDVPQEFAGIIGAIFGADEKPTATRSQLAAEIIRRISALDAIDENENFLEEYRRRLLFLGEEITVTCAGKHFTATALGIDEHGQLIVRKDGEILHLSSGEISIRGNQFSKIPRGMK